MILFVEYSIRTNCTNILFVSSGLHFNWFYLQAHNKRRETFRRSYMKNKKMTEEAKQEVWEERFKKRAAEKSRLEHDDSVKFFQVTDITILNLRF